jgi:tetratricopeptide (TPR) repeat protein
VLLAGDKTELAKRAAEELVAAERKVPGAVRREALLSLVKLSLDAGDADKAQEWQASAVKQLAADRANLAIFHVGCARAWADRKRWAPAATACHRLIATYPDQLRACYEAQALLVRALMAQGRHDDAVAAAKVLYGAAPNSEKEITDAVNLVMRALKVRHRSIALANDFVTFQSHGPRGKDGEKGTGDDIENPLARVQYAPAREIEARFQKTLEELKPDFMGRRWRGYLHLYWGKPDLALREFIRRYDEAPLEQQAIDEAIDDIVVALKAYCGHTLAGERFMAYQQLGPKGEDGRLGTADDLTDPLKEILKTSNVND